MKKKRQIKENMLGSREESCTITAPSYVAFASNEDGIMNGLLKRGSKGYYLLALSRLQTDSRRLLHFLHLLQLNAKDFLHLL